MASRYLFKSFTDKFEVMSRLIFLFILFITTTGICYARGVYQEPAEFVNEAFSNSPPQPKVIWLKETLRQQVESILGHGYEGQRIRYWQEQKRSAWILEEVGKTKPITVGIILDHGRIERIKVLEFRESRGWEVRHAFFTNQFNDAKLTDNNNLDKTIDGISGATLSVRALTKLARIALLLDQTSNKQ